MQPAISIDFTLTLNMCFFQALLNEKKLEHLVVHPGAGFGQNSIKPSHQAWQDKKHWAMNFRFPIPVWGHPVVVE